MNVGKFSWGEVWWGVGESWVRPHVSQQNPRSENVWVIRAPGEGGRKRGDSNLIGESCLFVPTSASWVWNSYYKTGFLSLSTIDISGQTVSLLWEVALRILDA